MAEEEYRYSPEIFAEGDDLVARVIGTSAERLHTVIIRGKTPEDLLESITHRRLKNNMWRGLGALMGAGVCCDAMVRTFLALGEQNFLIFSLGVVETLAGMALIGERSNSWGRDERALSLLRNHLQSKVWEAAQPIFFSQVADTKPQ